MWWAARNGFETIVTLLLTQGVDTGSRSSSGGTLLFWAAQNGYAAVVKPLLEKGWTRMLAHLKIGKRLCGGLPEIGRPLACAAEFGHEAVVRLLQAYGARSDFL